jgi:hypothetical protein
VEWKFGLVALPAKLLVELQSQVMIDGDERLIHAPLADDDRVTLLVLLHQVGMAGDHDAANCRVGREVRRRGCCGRGHRGEVQASVGHGSAP